RRRERWWRRTRAHAIAPSTRLRRCSRSPARQPSIRSGASTDESAVTTLSQIAGAVALARRRYYTDRPDSRRRLTKPVISVGNLTVGGSGKTPLVAYLAARLLERGWHPSILSRGYGRAYVADGVVVVSDGRTVLADLARSGDEHLMLARQLPGVAVLVSPNRHLAGRLAEARFGCDVHLLDDGFQHFVLERDIDLLVVGPDDVSR